MPWWTSLLGEAGGSILKPIADIVDSAITNKEERIKVETELKRVIFDYEAKIAEEVTKREQAALADMASARAMNMKTVDNQDKFIRRFPYYLALVIIGCVFGIFTYMLSGNVTAENKEIVYTLVGTLTVLSSGVVSFFFGSKRGSENKNETIKNLSTDGNRK